jgi:hypothetical protein
MQFYAIVQFLNNTQLAKDRFINDVSENLSGLRNNLIKFGETDMDKENRNRFKRTIEDFVASMTLEDFDGIEDLAIELDSMSEDLNIPLVWVHNTLINALENEIEAARKRAGERTNIRSSNLEEAQALLGFGMEEYVEGNIESSDQLIEAIQEAVGMTRARLGLLLSNPNLQAKQIEFAIKANLNGSPYLNFIYALSNILREYKEAEMN